MWSNELIRPFKPIEQAIILITMLEEGPKALNEQIDGGGRKVDWIAMGRQQQVRAAAFEVEQ